MSVLLARCNDRAQLIAELQLHLEKRKTDKLKSYSILLTAQQAEHLCLISHRHGIAEEECWDVDSLDIAPEEAKRVEEVIAESESESYWYAASKDGNRESHYRGTFHFAFSCMTMAHSQTTKLYT